MVARGLGVLLLLLGVAAAVLAGHDIAVLDHAATAAQRERLGVLDDRGADQYPGIVGDRDAMDRAVAEDAQMVGDVAQLVQNDTLLLPHVRAYSKRSLFVDLRAMRNATEGNGVARYEVADAAGTLDYVLNNGWHTLVAVLLMGITMTVGGLLATTWRWGRLGSLVVMSSAGPFFWLNQFGLPFLPLVLGIALFFTAPSLGLVAWIHQRFFPPTANPREVGKRMVLGGIAMLVASAGLSVASYAVAVALGAASFLVGTGGFIAGLSLIAEGVRAMTRSRP